MLFEGVFRVSDCKKVTRVLILLVISPFKIFGRKKKETGFILFSAENIDRHTLGHSNFRPKILFPLGDFFSSHFQLV